jgi:arylsulfatase A
VLDDLVEFSDFLPTLCEVGAAPLPDHYPGDGVSLLPVLKREAGVRKKDWVYLWYQGQVMVRNQHYSLLAKRDGSDAQLIRYQGPFDGSKIGAQEFTDQEKTLKSDFEKILRTRAKARLSGVDAQTRAKVGKAERGGKVIR